MTDIPDPTLILDPITPPRPGGSGGPGGLGGPDDLGHLAALARQWLGQVRVGEPQVFKNLAVFPLERSDRGDDVYMTLDEALKAGSFSVREVSESGAVPELVAVNQGSRPVLLVDGEELVGAKQNRIINITILVPAKREVLIPVSCVEQGRWGYRSRHFESADHIYNARSRGMKSAQVSESMHSGRGAASDQLSVWDEVAAQSGRMMNSDSPTAAMSDVYESHRTTLDEYVTAFSSSSGQVGAVFAIDGKMVGMDAFSCQRPYAAMLPKIIRSYALDAIDIDSEATGPEAAATRALPPQADVAREFIDELCRAEAEVYPAVGAGKDLRLHNKNLSGGVLLAEGRLVHVCAFALGWGPTAY